MRPIITILMALLAATLCFACSQETPPTVAPDKPVVTEPQPVSEHKKQALEEVKQEVKAAVTEVKAVATKQVEAVKAGLPTATDLAKTTTIAAVDIAKQQTTPALSGLTTSEPAISPAVSPAAPKPPVLVVYDASMGKVSFDHAAHSGRLACRKCHPTDPPQKIVIAKEIAHTLCKGCHKISGGKAPTACPGCHTK